MRLTREQAELVRASHSLIRERSSSFAGLFYHRLLHRYPLTRVLFPDDLSHQAAIFKDTIDGIVGRIDCLDDLLPDLVSLARRHVAYRVEAKHYPLIGEVLIDTFAEVLGDRFTPAMRLAWETLYQVVSGAMIANAYPEGPPRPC